MTYEHVIMAIAHSPKIRDYELDRVKENTVFTIGHVIKKLRKQQKITQETLCDGICTASYLSRIENGDVNVSDSTINALLQRLGQDAARYITYKTEKDLELQNKLYELRQHYSLNANASHKKLLEELLIEFDTFDCSIQQFLKLHTYIDLCREGDYSPDEMKSFLMNALLLTKKKIDLADLRNELFTQDEIMLLFNIAKMIKESGDSETPIRMLEQLCVYLEDKRISPEFVKRPYPLMMVALSSWLGLSGRYYDAISLCDKGIKFCIDYADFYLLSNFFYNKGYCLGKAGNSNEAIVFVSKAYHMALATERLNSANHYKDHLMKNYNYEI